MAEQPQKPGPQQPAPPPKGKGDPFLARRLFPDLDPIFSFRPRPLEAVKDDCVVVLDASALLTPYGASGETSLPEVEAVYGRLVKERRLVVPAQAAREFAKNRSRKMAELHDAVSAMRDSVQLRDVKAVPLLAELPEYKEAAEIRGRLEDLAKGYRKQVDRVVRRIEAWAWDDPVTEMYRRLFTGDVFREAPEGDSAADVLADLDYRKSNKVPPGFEDAGAGDLLIWKTVCGVGAEGKDVILVTLDEKRDWRQQSKAAALFARCELVDEFRRASQGRTIHLLRPSSMLALYDAAAAAVADIAGVEERTGEDLPEDLIAVKWSLISGVRLPVSTKTFPARCQHCDTKQSLTGSWHLRRMNGTNVVWFFPDGARCGRCGTDFPTGHSALEVIRWVRPPSYDGPAIFVDSRDLDPNSRSIPSHVDQIVEGVRQKIPYGAALA